MMVSRWKACWLDLSTIGGKNHNALYHFIADVELKDINAVPNTIFGLGVNVSPQISTLKKTGFVVCQYKRKGCTPCLGDL